MGATRCFYTHSCQVVDPPLKELHFMLHKKLSVLIAVCTIFVDGHMINSSSKMLTVNSYFALHRSQNCFCWGNLPEDLLNYIFQIHASNIIITAFRNSLLRIARRGQIHFYYRYIYKLEHYAVWDLPLVWNSLPLID